MRRSLALLLPLALVACHDGPAPLAPDASAPASPAAPSPDADAFVPGRLLVQMAPGADAASLAGFEVSSRRPVASGRFLVVDVPQGREMQIAERMRASGQVTFAEPDWIRTFAIPCELGSCNVPTDVYLGYKWDLHNDGTITNSTGSDLAVTGASDADIDWVEAYHHLGASFNGSATIGIIDSGVRKTHVELAGKVIGEYDFFAGDPDAADDYGHGTHVAGIAAGLGDGGGGVNGVAWNSNVKILAAKVCGPGFFGYGCPVSATADAIYWAVDNGADVLNLSLGGTSASTAEQQALQYAIANDVLPFCATGNASSSVEWPAAFPECVAVSATDWSDNLASYSSFGSQVEVSAPGGDDENGNGYSYILSAGYGSDTEYVFMSGTSMATPQAVGLAALLYALGETDEASVRSILHSTADDLGANGRDNQFGYGRINAYRAVTAVTGGGGPTNGPPSADFTFACTDLACGFTDASADADGSVVAWSWDFGDGASSSAQNPSHTYGAAGAYTVTLTVTDDGGASASTSKSVVVTEPAAGGITLAASGYKAKGRQNVDLTWSGAAGASVDVYRDGAVIATTANDGAHTDAVGARGGGSYVYRVCEAGTATCSPNVTVTF